jgi:Protein of unknown function (DUF2852)
MDLVAKIDDIGKPAWIGLMVIGFIAFWPIGLAILAFLLWSGRMGCRRHAAPGRWYRPDTDRNSRGGWWQGRTRERSSGNSAFDEYRDETLRRLEDEQKEFWEFLERLRHAKDKAEFDQFMAERGRRPQAGPEPQPEG